MIVNKNFLQEIDRKRFLNMVPKVTLSPKAVPLEEIKTPRNSALMTRLLNSSFFTEKLASKFWRLNNLYWIVNKEQELVLLKLRPAQLSALYSSNHRRKLILKTRQTGVSTLFLAKNFDSCITKTNFHAGIISIGLDEANKLKKKALLMWTKLDPDIKELLNIKLVSSNNKVLVFSNGSSLQIGNFRGDTLHSLHVSELAKISKKYPEKARELKAGAFQALGKEGVITVETTSEGPIGLFYNLWKSSTRKKKQGARLSPFDFDTLFISWMDDPDSWIDVPQLVNEKMEEYFTKLEISSKRKLYPQQKWWYVAKLDELGLSDMLKEYPSSPGEAFQTIVKGTFYAQEFQHLKIQPNCYDSNYPVQTGWDIGVNDLNIILFFQNIEGIPYIINEYKNFGKGLTFYREICNQFSVAYGYKYNRDYFPHDLNNREYGTGKTRLALARGLQFSPSIVKKYSFRDGIEITRGFLRKVTIDEKCIETLKAIQTYRRNFNEATKVYSDTPIHDEFSHWADALRYLACGFRDAPTQGKPIWDMAGHSPISDEYDGFAI